jgi:hypothetical protein
MKSRSNTRSRARKSSVSRGGTYAAIGEFWDEHDLSDFWDKTRSARADVELESEESLYDVEHEDEEDL